MDESGIEATQALEFNDEDETDDELDLTKPVAYLNVGTQKGFPGKLYPIYEGDNVIGRNEDCQVAIPLKALSREHACIEVKGDCHFIYDKGSRNRTKRNNHVLAATVRYEIKDKDQIIFGDVESQYQLNSQVHDDNGSETGSESMFQTAPDDDIDETSVDSKHGNDDVDDTTVDSKPGNDDVYETTVDGKPGNDDVDNDDYLSDASSDILELTQPVMKNAHSMLGTKAQLEETVNAQSVTVAETPVVSNRTKKLRDNIVLPESDTEDEEELTKEEFDTTCDRSSIIIAETQAYVSDIEEDDADDDSVNKTSLLMAPTQAFGHVSDSDVSTCSEASPQKKQLMLAATQAYTSPIKKKVIEPTQVYDMDVNVEPTVGYDMDCEDSVESNVDEETKQSNIMFEPTQAYDKQEVDDNNDDDDMEEKKHLSIMFEPTQAYIKPDKDTKDDDNVSESSEDFVLEGDTDAEDNDDDTTDADLMAEPTLQCNDDIMVAETQAVPGEDSTQVFTDNGQGDATMPVCNEPIKACDDMEARQVNTKTKKKVDKEVKDNEAPTQCFDDTTQRSEMSKETLVADTQVFEDATQVIENVPSPEKKSKPTPVTQVCDTQVFEDATQVIDNDSSPSKSSKHTVMQVADTQVFDDATQVIESVSSPSKSLKSSTATHVDATQLVEEDLKNDKNKVTADVGDTQVFNEEPNEIIDSKPSEESVKASDMTDAVKENIVKRSTGEFDKASDATQTFSETDGESLDFLGGATLAVDNDVSDNIDESNGRQSENSESNRATQVFDDVDETCDISDDLHDIDNVKSDKKDTNNDQDAATQVFNNADDNKETSVVNDTVAVVEVAETVPIGNDDATQVFDQSESEVCNLESSRKVVTTKGKKDKVLTNEEPTQVFDQTVAVEDLLEDIEQAKDIQKNEKKVTKPLPETDAPTQVFDETIPVDDISEEMKPTRGGRRKDHNSLKHKTELNSNEAPTQIFDEAIPIEEKARTKKPAKAGRKKQQKASKSNSEISETDTQVFEGIVDDVNSSDIAEQLVSSEKSVIDESVNESIEVSTSRRSGRKRVSKTNDDYEYSDKGKKANKMTDKKGVDSEDTKTAGANDLHDYNVDSGENSRGRRGKSLKNENNKSAKTEHSEEIGTSSKTVRDRKSGRNSSKIETTGSGENTIEPVRRGGRNRKKSDESFKTENVDNEAECGANKKKIKEEEKTIPMETEAATQIYADEGVDDAVTQRYGDESDRSAATQRYGDESDEEDGDITPDIETVLAKEAQRQDIPLPALPAKSPLKSALASPKRKEGSPSPKRVQFVSQNSETNSETSETSRRSTRGNKGKAKVSLDVKAEESKISTTRIKNSVSTSALSDVKSEIEKTGRPVGRGRRSVRTKEHDKTIETVTTEVQETTAEVVKKGASKIQSKNLKIVNDNAVTDDNVEVKSDEKSGESKTVSEDTIKVTRRGGRRVTSINIEAKPKSGRNSRHSLPAVIENEVDKNTVDKDVNDNSDLKKSNTRGSKTKKVSGEIPTIAENDSVSKATKVEPTNSRRSRRQTSQDNSISEKDSEENIVKVTEEKKDTNSSKQATRSKRGAKVKQQNEADNDQSENSKNVSKISKVKSLEKDTSSVADSDIVIEKKANVGSKTRSKKDNKKSENVPLTEQDSVTKTKRSSRRNTVDVNSDDTNKVTDNTSVIKEESIESKTAGTKLKRKQSSESSTKSKECNVDETPSKKSRLVKASSVSTPVSKSIQLDESISNSPTLRKTTVEGSKAKVMFTGVVDEQGQKIVKDLGGELVNSLTDCTHLVTDQVRRTVKFLCCLARGIPIVVPQWLTSSKASGFFVDSGPFLVSDDSSERKFKFSLEHSIDKANKEPLFNGYTIHVTKSVKPPPEQMKDILKCAGAKVCDTMPSNKKTNMIVVSCMEDKILCKPAIKLDIPIMSAEFILTGLLRQEVDLVSFKLDINEQGSKRSHPESNSESAKKRRK